MAMLDPVKPQPFTASTFNAVGVACDLRARVAELADRLAGSVPRETTRTGVGSQVAELHDERGLMDQVSGAGAQIHQYIADINADLDRIMVRLG